MFRLTNRNIFIVGLFFIALITVLLLNNPWVNPSDSFETQLYKQQNNTTEIVHQEKILGNNLMRLAYFSPQWVFVDLTKQGSTWVPIDTDGKRDRQAKINTPTDDSGYPLQVPFAGPNGEPQMLEMLLADQSYPPGEYLLLFDGSGEIELKGKNITYRQQTPNRYLVSLGSDRSRVQLIIKKSTKGDHIRNLRFIMPGFFDNYAEQVFHPLFLERLQGFQVLRFMPIMEINNSEVVDWQDRTKPNEYTQAKDAGIAPEYITLLANRTQSDIWINIPHLASDDYVKNFAQLLQTELKHNQKIYLEYSNELWNGQFTQAKWLQEIGCKDPETFVRDQSENDRGIRGCQERQAAANFHVKRIARIAEIFAEVFQDSFEERIVVVVAGQAANPRVAEQLLQGFDDSQLNPQGYRPDALAIAPYFGNVVKALEKEGITNSITVEDLLDRAEQHMREMAFERMQRHKDLANKYGITLITYEGGQHLVAGPQKQKQAAFIETTIEANRHPRMGELYQEYFKYWYDQVDGGLFVNFGYVSRPGQFGSWGILETQDQPPEEAPKYMAIKDIMAYLAQK